MGSQPTLSPTTDNKALVIGTRLEGAREAIKRSRLAFLATTIAAISIFTTEWNAYLSWYRRFPLKTAFPNNPVTEDAVRRVIQQYIESRVITISLLGIHIGVSDLAVLGTFALFVCSVWLFFNVRRENHLIGTLLVDTADEDVHLRRYVYYGISSFLVFTTATLSDEPIASLSKKEMEDQKNRPQSLSSKFFRKALSGLFIFPALVAFATIVFDILSLYVFPSVLGFPHDPLGYGALERRWKVQLVIMQVIALGFSMPTAYVCFKIPEFEKSIATLLQKYCHTLNQ